MTLDREGNRTAAPCCSLDQMRPSTSAGSRSFPLQTRCKKPEEPHLNSSTEMESSRDGKQVKRKPNKAAAMRKQCHVIDGCRHVATFLHADERRLHEQLLVASEKGNYRAIYLLLHQSLIDKDRCRGMHGYSPLHHAAARGHLEALQLLLDFGWGVDTRNDVLETPLHLASYGGHTRVAECLLDRGADVDSRTRDLETPLFYATRKGHNRLVRLLVRRECDLTVKNRYGDIAEDEAIDDQTKQELAAANEDYMRISSTTSKCSVDSPSCREVHLSQQLRERVLSFLDVRSLCFASQAAFRWHRAADNPALWRKLGVSRWELQLSSSMGLSASPLSMLTARRASTTGPSSDQTRSRFLIPGRTTSRRLPLDDSRPQTARNLLV